LRFMVSTWWRPGAFLPWLPRRRSCARRREREIA
jgi:hypothetical protein